jgi:hypothetical protein
MIICCMWRIYLSIHIRHVDNFSTKKSQLKDHHGWQKTAKYNGFSVWRCGWAQALRVIGINVRNIRTLLRASDGVIQRMLLHFIVMCYVQNTT